jgi:hypothetical protein
LLLVSCRDDVSKKEEVLSIGDSHQFGDSLVHSISGNTSFNQLFSSPNTVLLTGSDRFRLLTIYKVNPKSDRNIQFYESSSYNSYQDIDEDDDFRYFMPGMDIINGYNLVNVGLYDVENDSLTYFFQKPVLIKTLYFPGVKRDSLYRKPVSRNYYLVSVYDEDTNNDSLLNKRDLRRMYHFDEINSRKTRLLPLGYSAIKSTYDYKLDAMYIYARFDENGNGIPEKNEPVSIFMLRLNDPVKVRKII